MKMGLSTVGLSQFSGEQADMLACYESTKNKLRNLQNRCEIQIVF